MEIRKWGYLSGFRFGAITIAVSVFVSISLFVVNEASTTESVKGGQQEPKQESTNPPGLKDLLPLMGTIGAALVAGTFAVYQLRRSIAAQRALEREKLMTARTEAELA